LSMSVFKARTLPQRLEQFYTAQVNPAFNMSEYCARSLD
jgi:hypothetical protein